MPSKSIFSTRSNCRAEALNPTAEVLTASSEGMSVATRHIRLACVSSGFDAQQREDERPFDVEGPPFIDRPAEDSGDLLAGHFQMVLVGDVALGLPDDTTLGIERPALSGGRQGEQGCRK